jgi:hypothetical protein
MNERAGKGLVRSGELATDACCLLSRREERREEKGRMGGRGRRRRWYRVVRLGGL